MEKVELYLKYMNKMKNAAQSIDIYFNNHGPEFVVKVIHNLDSSQTKHFRNIRLKGAIEEACAYLEEQEDI
jgi:hypothetical protein